MLEVVDVVLEPGVEYAGKLEEDEVSVVDELEVGVDIDVVVELVVLP